MAKRFYSLFARKRDGSERRWRRISVSAWPKETAIRIFQSDLLAPYLGYPLPKGAEEGDELALRPVK